MHESGGPIGIAGSGRVARTLGRILQDHGGAVVSIAGRSLAHAREAAAWIGGAVEAVGYHELGKRARRVLIAVPDDAVESVAGMLDVPGGIALHTSGVRGTEALETLRRRGVRCGTLHPLQTIAEPAGGMVALRGAAFAISGDDAAIVWAEEIVRMVDGKVLRISAEARPMYHASAVMASNYVTVLLAAAQELMQAAGVERGDALRALGPLVRATVENALRLGPEEALTGPIERGDVATVSAHLAALRTARPSIEMLYRASGFATLEIARGRGLAAERAAEMEQILKWNSEHHGSASRT